MEKSDRSAGMSLRLLRTEKGVSLKEASEKIGISENYLSEIERDKKIPNDDIIRSCANYYGVDEKDLFDKFNKIALTVQEEIKENDTLSRTLYEISTNNTLSDKDKEKLYTEIRNLYEHFFNRK